MTDNRTTELQSLSKLKRAGRLRYWRGTIEMPESELHAICDEIQAEHDQAIAATLGRGTGEWVLEHSGTLYDKWRCSEFDYLYVESRTDGGATDFDPKFCPECGRKVKR